MLGGLAGGAAVAGLSACGASASVGGRPIPVAVDPALSSSVASRPNLVVILSDDQRADTIHALGNEAIRTPALDSLVARGTVCDRDYCMGSLVPAVCVPSRAMLQRDVGDIAGPDVPSSCS